MFLQKRNGAHAHKFTFINELYGKLFPIRTSAGFTKPRSKRIGSEVVEWK